MQAAKLADQLVAGAQIKVIGIREDDFRAEFFEGFIAKKISHVKFIRGKSTPSW